MLYLGVLDSVKFLLKFAHFNVVLSEEEVIIIIIIDTLLASGGGLESCYLYMHVMYVRC